MRLEKMMKKFVLTTLFAVASVMVLADITVSDVEVFSGYPWKEVVIGYTITGTDDRAEIVRLTATDQVANESYVVETGTSALIGADFSKGRHIMRWNAAAAGVRFSSSNVVFTVSVVSYDGVQLWENGPYWAECNVGATKPEEYGYYFWWGDTVGYKYDARNERWVSAKDNTEFRFSNNNCPTYSKNKSDLQTAGYIDATGNLVSVYDAATQYLGALWRIPTGREWEALITNCNTTWTTRNGIYGRLVTGKGSYASRSIFLPAAGRAQSSYLGASDADSEGDYWSASASSENKVTANGVSFTNDHFRQDSGTRCFGRSVRPVRGFAQ